MAFEEICKAYLLADLFFHSGLPEIPNLKLQSTCPSCVRQSSKINKCLQCSPVATFLAVWLKSFAM